MCHFFIDWAMAQAARPIKRSVAVEPPGTEPDGSHRPRVALSADWRRFMLAISKLSDILSRSWRGPAGRTSAVVTMCICCIDPRPRIHLLTRSTPGVGHAFGAQ